MHPTVYNMIELFWTPIILIVVLVTPQFIILNTAQFIILFPRVEAGVDHPSAPHGLIKTFLYSFFLLSCPVAPNSAQAATRELLWSLKK